MRRLFVRYGLLLVAVVVLNFLLPRLLPGDPLDQVSPDGLSAATTVLTAEARARLAAQYRLDQPLPAQFAGYLADLARGDLGWSIGRSQPVSRLIAERLPWTLGLVLAATLGAATLGVLLGTLAAWRGGRTDRAVLSTSTSLAAIPEFLVALGLLLVLSVALGWFPLQGGRSIFASPDSLGTTGALLDVVWHLALPSLTLLLAGTASFVLLTRGAVRAVLAEGYVNTARARGLTETRIALGHALPNALLPVLTLFGVRVGGVLGGAIVVERVFAVPGLGLLAFEAIRARDYPVLQAVFLLASVGVLLANLVCEFAYQRLEPRYVG
jgi:peptide/nickel transport system permease protein